MTQDRFTQRIGGFGVTSLIPGRQTGGAFALLEPGALGSPPHTHTREDEWSCVLAGTLTVDFGGRTVQAGPGEVVFKPRGEAHTFLNGGEVPVRFLELIAPAPFEAYFAELAPLVHDHAPPDLPGLLALAARYGLSLHLDQLPRLAQQYGLALPGLSAPA